MLIEMCFYSRQFNERRMGSDVNGEILGEAYKGYTFRITGGNDKQGFTMKQGILINGRVRILMKESKLFFHLFTFWPNISKNTVYETKLLVGTYYVSVFIGLSCKLRDSL